MKFCILAAVAAVGALSLGGIARGSSPASDSAANNPPYVPNNGFNGLNGGSGFGPWNIVQSTNGSFVGNFVAATSNAGDNAPALDIYSDVGETINAYRPLTGGALAPGQTISVTDILGSNANGGNGGFALTDAAGLQLVKVYSIGGTNQYVIDDANGTAQPFPNTIYNYHGVDTFAFTLGAGGAYTLGVTGASTSSFSGNINTATGGISQFDLLEYHGGNSADVQLESLSVAPEPASIGLLGLAGVGLLARRRRVI